MSSHRNERHKSWMTHGTGAIGRNGLGMDPPVTADYEPSMSARGTRNRHYCPECGMVRSAILRYDNGELWVEPHRYNTGNWERSDCKGGYVDPVEDRAP